MQNNQIEIKDNSFFVKKRSVYSRLLPVLVMLSFVWLNLYTIMTSANNIKFDFGSLGNFPVYLFFDTLLYGLLYYLMFEFFFYVYRFFIGFSIYSFMIPKDVLIDKFRTWYLIRNVVLGLIFNLRFFFPYLTTYLCVFELLLNFLLIICMYFDLSKEYVEPLVGQFVFKTLAVPVVLYEILEVIILMAGVL